MADEKEKKHAILSPSGADRWMTCPGSVALSKGMPDDDNEYSKEGTDLHEVGAVCLQEEVDADTLIGSEMLSGALLTEDQAVDVQKYVDAVRTYRDSVPNGVIRIEEEVPLTSMTGEVDAEGTSDAVVISQSTELIVIDAKFGRGVEVDPEKNRQCMMYGIGALDKHELWDSIKTVRLVISQPRLSDSPKEWVTTIDELKAFKEEVTKAAARVDAEPTTYVPSQKACKFCKAKSKCPALGQMVDDTMLDGFEDITQAKLHVEEMPAAKLGDIMARIPLMEDWIKSIRAETERRLLSGDAVPGWKIVIGKKGNRAWADVDLTERLLKKAKVKEDCIYAPREVLSVSAAEKKLKKAYPDVWKLVSEQGRVTQAEGQKSVAPEADPRPAVQITAPDGGFDDVSDQPTEEGWEDLL